MRVAAALLGALSLACGPAQVETAQSPVQGRMRPAEAMDGGLGRSEFRGGEAGTVTAKLLTPAPMAWEAILSALAQRHVTPTLIDRGVGRAGDTALVLLRSWNGHQLSYYFDCGSTMTGLRANEERLRAVLLAQLTRLPGDSIGVAVHLSATAHAINSGSSTRPSQCASTGRGEGEFLDEVIRTVGGSGRRT